MRDEVLPRGQPERYAEVLKERCVREGIDPNAPAPLGDGHDATRCPLCRGLGRLTRAEIERALSSEARLRDALLGARLRTLHERYDRLEREMAGERAGWVDRERRAAEAARDKCLAAGEHDAAHYARAYREEMDRR